LNREEATPALAGGARESAKKDWGREEIPFATFKKLCGLPFFAVKNWSAPKRETIPTWTSRKSFTAKIFRSFFADPRLPHRPDVLREGWCDSNQDF